MISYEYPLNERIRTLLRLEDLYDKVRYFSTKSDGVEHHVALTTLFDILEMTARADLKSDLLQELERQKHSLEALRHNPAIEVNTLDAVLHDIDQTAAQLHSMSGKPGQHLRENEWVMGIKQRANLPGGVCQFDLPSYHFWLNQPAEVRRRDLEDWLNPMLPIYAGLSIVLRLLRESGSTKQHIAQQGMFQQMQSGRMAQLVRITLSSDLPCTPEISANKYALNIRFTTMDGVQRPRICDRDIEFNLTFCNL